MNLSEGLEAELMQDAHSLLERKSFARQIFHTDPLADDAIPIYDYYKDTRRGCKLTDGNVQFFKECNKVCVDLLTIESNRKKVKNFEAKKSAELREKVLESAEDIAEQEEINFCKLLEGASRYTSNVIIRDINRRELKEVFHLEEKSASPDVLVCHPFMKRVLQRVLELEGENIWGARFVCSEKLKLDKMYCLNSKTAGILPLRGPQVYIIIPPNYNSKRDGFVMLSEEIGFCIFNLDAITCGRIV